MVVSQKWYQSKVTILALAALIGFVSERWIGFKIPDWTIFVELVLGVLMGLGIINNGTNPIGFGANKVIVKKK
jgi:hypothetical protein